MYVIPGYFNLSTSSLLVGKKWVHHAACQMAGIDYQSQRGQVMDAFSRVDSFKPRDTMRRNMLLSE